MSGFKQKYEQLLTVFLSRGVIYFGPTMYIFASCYFWIWKDVPFQLKVISNILPRAVSPPDQFRVFLRPQCLTTIMATIHIGTLTA